ncbi:CoA-binding protein [Sulfuricaulis limicola]|uniref:CoA-binding protein n=1 Tax=Sulfuricaulis limicola TaxID=1620215 RepID=A0A1B4XDV3_9GAMM|nr:CoA-binding protein [Sulfuricaulis limicola]BAV32987.1 CoA-binding protein [Sulfuricaulis limicola]
MGIFQNPPDEEIRELLRRVRAIAVVGLSPRTNRPSHGVAAQMQRFGYRIIPVRPAVDTVLGEKAYASLREVPDPFDLVDVFRAPEYVGQIVEECIALGVPAIWLQEGVVNIPAAERAQQAGLTVVMDRCVYREYLRLFGPVPHP